MSRSATYREYLEEYRYVTRVQLELQSKAVQRQQQIGRLYQGVVAVGGVVLIAIVVFFVWWFGRFRKPSTPEAADAKPEAPAGIPGTLENWSLNCGSAASPSTAAS